MKCELCGTAAKPLGLWHTHTLCGPCVYAHERQECDLK